MEGKVFPQGTEVLEFIENKNDQSYYLCKCTKCGNEFKQDGYSTRIGRQGCKNCRKNSNSNIEILDEPYIIGSLTREWWARRIIQVLKKRRKTNPDFEYDLTMEYAWDLFLKQEGKCVFTDLNLTFPEKKSLGGTASLDRIDSNKGYIKENVQWVHTTINNMKNNMSDKEFIEFCELVTINQKN